jgi:ribosomal-protein-alanine N-acetyltransferase
MSDTQRYLDYMSDDRMAGFLTKENRPHDFSKAEQELRYWSSLFENKRSIYWCIALKEGNIMIGTVGFNVILLGHDRAEISYDLDPEYWGNGIMLKSIKAIIKYSDFILGLKRIQATVIIDNHRSIKLLERCSFEREGYLKKYEIVEGEHKDYYMYARVV